MYVPWQTSCPVAWLARFASLTSRRRRAELASQAQVLEIVQHHSKHQISTCKCVHVYYIREASAQRSIALLNAFENYFMPAVKPMHVVPHNPIQDRPVIQ
jgi:hypothetical protein